MKPHLIIATRNKGKIAELAHLLEGMDIAISSLGDHPEIPDVVEDGDTFLANARKKAGAVRDATGEWVLADDSGLVVPALNGAPGVKSARYGGGQGDYAANNRKLLMEMSGVPDGRRGAAFVCTIVLAAPDGREWNVEGRCEGVIIRNFRGAGGFGYDPLFFIPEEGKTMAELSTGRKNEISHRGRAFEQIKKILVEIFGKKGEE